MCAEVKRQEEIPQEARRVSEDAPREIAQPATVRKHEKEARMLRQPNPFAENIVRVAGPSP